jgi:hypothetical protein
VAPPRLLLHRATRVLLDAAVDAPDRLGPLLDAAVAEDWPGFPKALPRLRDTYAAHPDGDPWGTYLFLLEEPRTLIGMGGFKGPPSPQGRVERSAWRAPGEIVDPDHGTLWCWRLARGA